MSNSKSGGQSTDTKSTTSTDSGPAETSVIKTENQNVEMNNTNAESSSLSAHDERNSKTPRKKAAQHPKKRAVPWAAIFAVVLIIGLGLGNYWQYQQGQQLKQIIERVAGQQSSQGEQIDAIEKNVTEMQNGYKSLTSQVDQTEMGRRTLLGTVEQMSQQIKSLAAVKGKEPLFWRVSEVEYLLTVANHRLVLERDVLTAKTALQDADNRLRIIADPALIPVREKISQEINLLNNVLLPDIPGMTAQLRSVIEGVHQLPFEKKILALESEPTSESEKEFKGVGNFLKTVWRDLVDGLFKVQRSSQPIEPLLPPEEKLYLVYNLELKLEQARVSLLNQDTALFRTNLEDVEKWVGNYFDRESVTVINLLQMAGNLKQVELQPPLPDISASLRELRSWLETQKQESVASRQNALTLAQFTRFAAGADNP
ncbi:MAG: uroporphyrinogen-III C-methyltransferase [Gammaproteobacteria bacterium]|nr:uroporphyrinogen-III C-methyltransferase [Gammaproteobacteria bacterium]